MILFILILDIISIIVAYGDFIEISGIMSVFIFAVPVILNIIFLKKYVKKLFRIIILCMVLVYFVSGGLSFIRENNSGRNIVYNETAEKYTYQIHEINPGAMGSLRYEKRIYRNILDSDFLKIRIKKISEFYKYYDFISFE